MPPSECPFSGLQERLIAWRRALHRRPEVGLELPKTLAFLERELGAMGLFPRRMAGGIVVDVGKAPRRAWRTDMDALPIQEETGLAFASEIPGAMHACGHDAHAAIALGIAWTLSRHPEPPAVRFIFQPGEEGRFGARGMIESGALEGVEALCGLHVGCLAEGLPPGHFAIRAGAQMASGDRFRALFRGRGTHGAQPQLGRDPLPAAAAFVGLTQTIRAREVAPGRLALVTVGFFRAGEADNVVPETAELKGIVRTEDPGDRALLERRLGEAARGLAQAHGVELEWTWSPGYPAVRNDSAWVERAEKAVSELFGAESLLRLERPVATAEDVAFYLERVPGAYVFLGTNNPGKGITEPHHSPRFDVDEDQLWKGVALGAELLGRP